MPADSGIGVGYPKANHPRQSVPRNSGCRVLNFTPEKWVGILLCLPLLIAALVKEGGMGGGDVKLVAACGFVLGITAGGAGLIIGMSAVLVWHLVLNGIHKLKRSSMLEIRFSTLPLAPFLSLGFIAMAILKLSG